MQWTSRAPGVTVRSMSSDLSSDLISDLFSLADRTCLVTGGSKGLGRHMAEAFLAAGAHRVYITARNADAVQATAEALTAAHDGECIALPVCMGGCPQQRRRTGDRDEQCGTFRNNHHDRINRVARALLGTDLPSADAARRALGFVVHPTGTATETGAAHITAVSLSPARRLPSTRPGERSKPSAQVP